MSTAPDDTPAPRRKSSALWLIPLALILALGGGYAGWKKWQAHEQSMVDDAQHQVEALSQRLNALRTEQRSHSRRLQQADSLNRVLRDELNGISQRAALLEDSVSKLADPDRNGAQALRLNEAELLLTMGEQRLQIAGDLDGARRAYALASGVLNDIDDPAYVSLRQTLLQERATLDALDADPRVLAIARLEVFAQSVTAPIGRDAITREPRRRGGSAPSATCCRCSRPTVPWPCRPPTAPRRWRDCSWKSRWRAPPPNGAT